MALIFTRILKIMPAFLLFLALGCGQVNQEKYVAGDEPGDVNHANPLHEKQDETGDGFTREAQDGSEGAEVGPSPGADTTNTDSTHVTPRMSR